MAGAEAARSRIEKGRGWLAGGNESLPPRDDAAVTVAGAVGAAVPPPPPTAPGGSAAVVVGIAPVVALNDIPTEWWLAETMSAR